MKKYLINYADKTYFNSQKLNTKTALEIGGFDEVISYNRASLGDDFLSKSKHILDQPRGVGYWLWKPYLILKTLEKLEDGDLLFYCDAGIEFLKSIDEIIPFMDETEEKLLLFELEDFHPNKRWTKRDCFINLGLDAEPYISQTQLLASYVLMRKNHFVISFMKQWLLYGQDYRNITDSPNELGLPNYPEFVDHRHDQSILSLLGRKYGIRNIPDIGQYGEGRWITSQIINHHRIRM
jgi:hypothetical protein